MELLRQLRPQRQRHQQRSPAAFCPCATQHLVQLNTDGLTFEVTAAVLRTSHSLLLVFGCAIATFTCELWHAA